MEMSSIFTLFVVSSSSSQKLQLQSTPFLHQRPTLPDGRTLVSDDGTFALGFFSPGTPKNRYLGIWYNNIPMQNVVWVANRINPINDSTGVLKIENNGRILLQVQNWTDERGSNRENYLWQSFNYPSDTMLPGMKIGVDLRTGLYRRQECE
ncbi:hypothetical protein V6N13_085199 [Hibiscus sabdariffa]|uniref:Bulb-type lectin domain-containing protein n=1 Tax=Hibiscus sabdariffa TaxID=183260 RepID=A0ABR2D0V7_9ROSI